MGLVNIVTCILKHIHTGRSTDVHKDSPAEEESVTQHSEGMQPFIVVTIYHGCSYVISVATDTSAEMRGAGVVTEGLRP